MQLAANYEITQSLKIALKSRGMTYRDLAKKIQVSEQTVKRLFKDKDCSLSRLNQICDAIDLSVYDLLEYAKHHTEPLAYLTPEQEHYLNEHVAHFYFLYFLTSKHTLEDIQATYNLRDIQIYQIMRDLQEQGFIDLWGDNQYRLKIEGQLLLKLHSPVHNIVADINHRFFDYVVENDGSEDTSFNSSFRFMSKNTLNQLAQELDELHDKYRKIAHQNEMILPKEDLVPVKWTTLVSPYAICGKWPLSERLKKIKSWVVPTRKNN